MDNKVFLDLINILTEKNKLNFKNAVEEFDNLM